MALNVAATDGGGWKINQLSATSSDPDRVRIEQEILTKDSSGTPLRIHERDDLAMQSPDRLFCIVTVTYYSGSSTASSGSVRYGGLVNRAGHS